MRKAITILVFLSYALCAFGFSVTYHYCGGEFKYLTLHNEDHEIKCCNVKEGMADDCCKDSKISYKKTDDKAQSYIIAGDRIFAQECIHSTGPYTGNHLARALPEQAIASFKPPPKRTGGEPLYILYSVYLI